MTDAGATADIQTDVSAGTTVSVTPAEQVPVRDRLTVRIVVIAIAVIVAVPVVIDCARSFAYNEPISANVWDIAKILGGALVALLASTSSVKS